MQPGISHPGKNFEDYSELSLYIDSVVLHCIGPNSGCLLYQPSLSTNYSGYPIDVHVFTSLNYAKVNHCN